MILDCSGNAKNVLKILPDLKWNFPELSVILLDGGLNQQEVVSAFQKGVKDYFAAPYNLDLLLERVENICVGGLGRLEPL